MKDIAENKLSTDCLKVIANDIRTCKDYGMRCDEVQWIKLLNQIEEELGGKLTKECDETLTRIIVKRMKES